MCRAIEEMIKQTVLEQSKRVARRMLAAEKYSMEEIVDITDLSLNEIKVLQAESNVQSSISAPETEKVTVTNS